MEYLILIDRTTIKKNPNAGKSIYLGSVLVRSTPEPAYSHEYIPTTIECIYCHFTFLHTELEEDDVTCEFGCHHLGTNICPRCRRYNCCGITFEQFNKSMV